jgi:hypothetical protein
LANEFDLNLKEWEFEPLVFDTKLEASEDDYEKIVLNYTQQEHEIVKQELLKHGKTYEAAVWNLLGLQ